MYGKVVQVSIPSFGEVFARLSDAGQKKEKTEGHFKMKKINTAKSVLLLFLLIVQFAGLSLAQDQRPLLDLTTEELLDDFSRFPEFAKPTYKGKLFRFTGRISFFEKDSKSNEVSVRFEETPKRQVLATLRRLDPDFIKTLAVGQELTFSAFVSFWGEVSDGRFVVGIEDYLQGLPYARPVEPIKTQVQISRALRVIHVGKMISPEEISSVFGKPFDEKVVLNPSATVYGWVLGKHLVTIQIIRGKIFQISQQPAPQAKNP